MNLPRRAVIGLVALAALGAAVVLLVPRFRPPPDEAAMTGAADAGGEPAAADDQDARPRTSEELIAAALTAGEITYEESLLARAYALYGDRRLQPEFRSPLIDWEAGRALLGEVSEKEAILSRELLAALLPFRVRPNDPRSIFNQPLADVVRAQLTSGAWVSEPVPFTKVRIWMKGPRENLIPYVGMVQRIWRVFNRFFPLPREDNGEPDPNAGDRIDVDPDDAVDLFLVSGRTVDPRTAECQRAAPDPDLCILGNDFGVTNSENPTADAPSAAFLLVNLDKPAGVLTEVIAHELAHVTQINTGYGERNSRWLVETTATYVGYKVAKAVGVVPIWAYEWLEHRAGFLGNTPVFAALFKSLSFPLTIFDHQYSGWLYFYCASMQLGDGIVAAVWKQAAAPGTQNIDAVNAVIPFNDHFPQFTLRNWNRDPVIRQYKTKDDTFWTDLKPTNVRPFHFAAPRIQELPPGTLRLSADYYRFTFDDVIRKATFQNLMAGTPFAEYAHVWALMNIDGVWKEPQDWSDDFEHVLCRDSEEEAVTELILIVSNSHMTEPLPRQPKLRMVAEGAGCAYIEGWGEATLRIKDDSQDVRYVSSRAQMRFKPRDVQDQPGNMQYDLLPTAVTWTAVGRQYDCTVKGQWTIAIPGPTGQPHDPTRLAYGYLNVVGLDGGNFHSIEVRAYGPPAVMTRTCPGDPPIVTTETASAALLLQVLSAPNATDADGNVYKGQQTFDPDRIQNNIPMSPGAALTGLLDSPGRGFITPEIQQKLKEAQEALDRVARESSGRMVYTFKWDLKPLSGATTPK
jgi:hypothetical protein